MSWRERREAGPLAESTVARLARLVGSRSTVAANDARPGPSPAPGGLDDGVLDPWSGLARDGATPDRPRAGWNPRSGRALFAIVLACAVVSAWWWWSGRPRPVIEPAAEVTAGPAAVDAPGSAPPTSPLPGPQDLPGDVVVHVAGLVSRPGLVRLPAGSRVADAIEAAGGVTKPRAADSVNLARVLVDGEQVVVTMGAPAGGTGTPAAPPLVDLNQADQAALESLPGVGPVLAARVLAWRAANGPFRSVDELGEVAGIGQATLGRLRPLVRV